MRLRDAPFPLPPFFYPTRVLHVDDHADYLSQLPLITPADTELVGFTSPRAAQQALQQSLERDSTARAFNFVDFNGNASELAGSIHRIIYDGSRFADCSVVIADLTMPEMDGIEFLRGLAPTAVGRILLSGRQATELALNAFNQGMIEGFLDKGHAHLAEQLAGMIGALRWRYFMRTHALLIEQLTRVQFPYLRDPVFVEALKHRLVRIDAVEMYVCTDPGGLLFLDSRGAGAFVVVQTAALNFEHGVLADGQGVAADVRAGIRAGSLIAVAPPGIDLIQNGFDAATRFIPATRVRGLLDDYTVGLMPDLQRFELDRVRSYEDWLWQQAETATLN
jgi:CheY-like chemotaxis protein